MYTPSIVVPSGVLKPAAVTVKTGSPRSSKFVGGVSVEGTIAQYLRKEKDWRREGGGGEERRGGGGRGGGGSVIINAVCTL